MRNRNLKRKAGEKAKNTGSRHTRSDFAPAQSRQGSASSKNKTGAHPALTGEHEENPGKTKMSKTQTRVFWYLKKIPLLKDLPPREWERIQKNVEIRELPRRMVIYLPGDPGDSVFFVNGGRVKVSKVTRDGREITLMYHGPGEIFGENCLFHENPREEMVETSDESLVSVLPKSLIENLMKRQSKFLMDLYKIVSVRRRKVEDRVQHLLFRDVNAKLAELILDFGEQYGIKEPDGKRISLKITHQEMANLIGSTRETVSLTLSHFRKQKLIRLQKRQVMILDEQGLRALL